MATQDLAATPVAVGESEFTFGTSTQQLLELLGWSEVVVVAVEFFPIMDPQALDSKPGTTHSSPLAEVRNTSQVTPVVSVRLFGRPNPGGPYEQAHVDDRPQALSLALHWVNFNGYNGSAVCCFALCLDAGGGGVTIRNCSHS